MSKSGRSPIRWVLMVVRYGLCVAAIVFLVRNVNWHDQIHLQDENGPWVRLLEQRDDGFVVERDGQRETLPAEQIHHVDVQGQRIPDVKLGIPSVVMQLDRKLALLAILLFGPVWFISSIRLLWMLGIQGVALSYWNSVKLTFAGNFFNFALPGTTGGDLIKAYYVTHYTHKKTEVVTTIFLDRAVGLLGLVILAGVAMMFIWDPEQFGSLVTGLGILLGALIVGGIVVFSQRVRGALRLSALAERLPLGAQLLRVGRATVAMRQHKLRVVGSLGVTIVLQSIVMISAAVMAKALHMHGDLAQIFIYVSVGFLIAAIPISPPQAFGVMEYFYVLFFTKTGMNTPSQAVALALAVRLIQLTWALPGVLVPLLGAHLPKKEELEALEHAAEDDGADAADASRRGAAAGES